MLRYTGDWERLNEFGFEEHCFCYLKQIEKGFNICIHRMDGTFFIDCYEPTQEMNIDTLYDLIISGLVEKVVEE